MRGGRGDTARVRFTSRARTRGYEGSPTPPALKYMLALCAFGDMGVVSCVGQTARSQFTLHVGRDSGTLVSLADARSSCLHEYNMSIYKYKYVLEVQQVYSMTAFIVVTTHARFCLHK